MSFLHLHNIAKSFDSLIAVSPLDLEIRNGEFFSLLGPSGCGKTTLLRIIAGLEAPTSGEIIIDGVDATLHPPQKRNIGIVFQNYALFPHMTVFENVAYGLEVKKLSKNEIRQKVERALRKVRLDGKSSVPVPNLSGGEQQRVALARAVIVEPRILLFDEPLSNLDHALRIQTRSEIKRLQREVGITTVYVTHDQNEAMSLSDRIAVMKAGTIQQTDTPKELYYNPRNAFVASFIGHANLFSPSRSLELFGRKNFNDDEMLAVLPEEISLSLRKEGSARIVDIQFLGDQTGYTVDLGGQLVYTICPSSRAPSELTIGSCVSLSIPETLSRKVRNE